MSQLPLNALRVFESVVRRGSFREAADELCVSQSAVSHQIKHLEQWFAHPLFDRTGRRPQVLPQGEILALKLKEAFSEIDQACQRTRRSSGPLTLVIAAIPSVAVCWLIPRLSGFREEHPEIAIRIMYAFHGQSMDFGDIDLAFVYADGEPVLVGTQAHAFLPGISAPVCSPAISDAMGGRSLLEDASNLTFLHDSNTLGWELWFAQANGGKPPSRSGPTFEDFNLLHAAVLAGQGVALCPLAMLQDDLESGRLIQLSEVAVMESFNYYLVEQTISDTPTARATHAFKTWLFK